MPGRDRLDLVRVDADGQAGEVLGSLSLSLNGQNIVADGQIVVDTLDMLRRRSRLDDVRLWAFLAERGWSNGQIMIRTT